MNRQETFEVLAIQRCMATANPLAWRDAIVVEVSGAKLGVLFLDGALADSAPDVLRVVGPQVDLAVGEPVAYHPVAEILAVGGHWTTARV